MDAVDATRDVVVAVADEPMHHELWRTATLRVLRADFPAHSTCLWHEHRRYTVYLCITDVDVLEHKYGGEPVPLRLARGHVMCRDHSAEPLIHRATTKDDRVVLVGVEIQQAVPATDHVKDEEDCIFDGVCVYRDSRSRVDRLEVNNGSTAYVRTTTEAVLVALSDCDLFLRTNSPSGHDKEKKSEAIQLHAGSAVPLPKGENDITLQAPTTATLFVVQIYG